MGDWEGGGRRVNVGRTIRTIEEGEQRGREVKIGLNTKRGLCSSKIIRQQSENKQQKHMRRGRRLTGRGAQGMRVMKGRRGGEEKGWGEEEGGRPTWRVFFGLVTENVYNSTVVVESSSSYSYFSYAFLFTLFPSSTDHVIFLPRITSHFVYFLLLVLFSFPFHHLSSFLPSLFYLDTRNEQK